MSTAWANVNSSLSTRSSPPNSCFVLLERGEALAKVEDDDGLVYIAGSEPASWCVGTALGDGVVADGCGDLDDVLSYEGPPAGGRTFCTDSHGVILGYYASNYGLSVLAQREGVWTSLAELNLGERPLIDAMAEAGIPDDEAAALCAAIPKAEDGLDPGC